MKIIDKLIRKTRVYRTLFSDYNATYDFYINKIEECRDLKNTVILLDEDIGLITDKYRSNLKTLIQVENNRDELLKTIEKKNSEISNVKDRNKELNKKYNKLSSENKEMYGDYIRALEELENKNLLYQEALDDIEELQELNKEGDIQGDTSVDIGEDYMGNKTYISEDSDAYDYVLRVYGDGSVHVPDQSVTVKLIKKEDND